MGILLHPLEHRDRPGAGIGERFGRLECLDRRLLSGGAGDHHLHHASRTIRSVVACSEIMMVALGPGETLVHHHRGEIQVGTRLTVGLPLIRTTMNRFGSHVHQSLVLEVGGQHTFSLQGQGEGRVGTAIISEGFMSAIRWCLGEKQCVGGLLVGPGRVTRAVRGRLHHDPWPFAIPCCCTC